MNTCARCGQPVASDGRFVLFGEPREWPVVCDTCADIIERERQVRAYAESWRDLWRAGLIARKTADEYPHALTEPTESQARALREVAPNGLLVQGLWAWGTVGCGKTTTCHNLMVRHHMNGDSVAEVSARRLLRDGDRHPLWERLLTADVLLVDDLDKAVWTEISASVWWEVTDRRADRPTLITANSSGSDFARTLTGAGLSDNWIRPALSRLMPIVGVKMTGEDLRKKGKEKA